MGRGGAVAKSILARIEKGGPGTTWSYSNFKGFPSGAVAKTLSRLAKRKKLIRARKGVYHYPKSTVLGLSTSSPVAVIGASYPATYFGATTASYNLGLTTQVPAGLVLFGDVSYGKSDIMGMKVRFRRRNVAHLKSLGETEINIIEALRNIKKIPAITPAEVVTRLKKELKALPRVRKFLKALEYEPPRVRALVGAMCEELGLEMNRLEALRKTLNSLTHYSLGVKDVLSFAHKWNIK